MSRKFDDFIKELEVEARRRLEAGSSDSTLSTIAAPARAFLRST